MIGDILGKIFAGYLAAALFVTVVVAVIVGGLALYQFEWSNIGLDTFFDGGGGGGGCNGDTDCAEFRQDQYLDGRP